MSAPIEESSGCSRRRLLEEPSVVLHHLGYVNWRIDVIGILTSLGK